MESTYRLRSRRSSKFPVINYRVDDRVPPFLLRSDVDEERSLFSAEPAPSTSDPFSLASCFAPLRLDSPFFLLFGRLTALTGSQKR